MEPEKKMKIEKKKKRKIKKKKEKKLEISGHFLNKRKKKIIMSLKE